MTSLPCTRPDRDRSIASRGARERILRLDVAAQQAPAHVAQQFLHRRGARREHHAVAADRTDPVRDRVEQERRGIRQSGRVVPAAFEQRAVSAARQARHTVEYRIESAGPRLDGRSSVVDEIIGTQRRDELASRAARGRRDPCAACLRDLHGDMADAARGAVHQDPAAGRHLREVAEGDGGGADAGQRRGIAKIDVCRQSKQRLRWNRAVLGKRALCAPERIDKTPDAVAWPDTLGAATDLRHHAGEIAAHGPRQAVLHQETELACGDLPVHWIDTRVPHTHEHLARAGFGRRHVLEPQVAGRPERMVAKRLHARMNEVRSRESVPMLPQPLESFLVRFPTPGFRPGVAMLAVLVTFVAGCGEPQTPDAKVRAVIAQGEQAAEARDLSGHHGPGRAFIQGRAGRRSRRAQAVSARLSRRPPGDPPARRRSSPSNSRTATWRR